MKIYGSNTLFGSVAKFAIGGFRALRTDDDGNMLVAAPVDKPLEVEIQDIIEDPLNVYIHVVAETPTLSGTQSVGSYVVTMTPTTAIAAGHAVTLVQNGHVFQSIVKSKTASDITIVSPLDYAFTTAAICRAGAWNINLNGSVTPVELTFPYIPGYIAHLKHISFNMVDASPMDSSTFGSLTALTNGLVVQHKNSHLHSLSLMVNNIGFKEQGYDTFWHEKPPAGNYGVTHVMNLVEYFGVALQLSDNPSSNIKVIIQDDLTGLDTFTCTIGGHIAT